MSLSGPHIKPWIENVVLASALPWVAGAVNATGFFAVGSYTSHVSGHVARAGDELAQRHGTLAWKEGLFVLAFLLGAITATALIESAKRRERARYAVALFVEATVLTLFTFFSARFSAEPSPFLICLLSFSMGLQNALVTRMSGAVVRTTHMTGVTTDIGIESVRAFLWMRDHRRAGTPLLGLLQLLPQDPELKRLRLHLLILASFFAGAVSGPASYLAFGGTAMLLPVLVLFGLFAFDAVYGIQGQGARGGEASGPVPTVAPPEQLPRSRP